MSDVRLLLDEMYPAAAALGLRDRRHDVIAVQEIDALRGLDDGDVFALGQLDRRCIVTENVRDFVALAAGAGTHHGLVFTSDRRFPRHHDRFVGALVTALDAWLSAARPQDIDGRQHWLEPSRAPAPP